MPTGVLVAPLMPGINDAPEQVEEIVELATEAGATYIGGQALFLRGATKDVFMGWLREQRPDLRRALRAAVREARTCAGERRQARLRRRRAVGRGRTPRTRSASRRGGAGRRRRCSRCPRETRRAGETVLCDCDAGHAMKPGARVGLSCARDA